jgi:putative endonuclease
VGAWLYILKCADGSYYTGSTRADLEIRVAQHQSGHFGGYTSTRRPVVLVHAEHFDTIVDAIAAERQVKEPSQEGSPDGGPIRFVAGAVEATRLKVVAFGHPSRQPARGRRLPQDEVFSFTKRSSSEAS